MRLAIRVIATTLVISLLTLLTQVGGLIYFMALATFPFIDRRISNQFTRIGAKLLSFIVLYSLGTFFVVPAIAKRFNKIALPVLETNHVRPRNIITCILNRHYVRPELASVTSEVATKMNEDYPGTILNYLDAGFPLFNKYPLFPHLSHNDGKKLDIALLYVTEDDTPSPIGYGVYEGPRDSEPDQPFRCGQKGYWQYSFLQKFVSQRKKASYTFDERRTRSLCNFFLSDSSAEKIFIEPHLKLRLKLTSSKVRYHGCQAVRHDDHIHVQIK